MIYVFGSESLAAGDATFAVRNQLRLLPRVSLLRVDGQMTCHYPS